MTPERYKQLLDSVGPTCRQEARLRARMKEALHRRQRPWARVRRSLMPAAGSLSAAVLAFAMGVNLSPAFAAGVEPLPVLGELARVLTIRQEVTETPSATIQVEEPALSQTGKDWEEEANRQIHQAVEEQLVQAQQRAEEYRAAVLATGGTQEDYEQRQVKVEAGYEVKSQTDATLSFVVWARENWTSAYDTEHYYNLDLESGRELTLEDLLGEDYIQQANQAIQQEINRQPERYFAPEKGGFTSISEETPFYLNEDGQPVVVFAPYEIAPGSEGKQEFVIPLPESEK